MTTPVSITGHGARDKACVTGRGQLVTAPLAFNNAASAEMDATATAFNLLGPVAGKCYVIDSVLLSAASSVSNTVSADVELYEADAPDNAAPSKTLIPLKVARFANVPIVGLNLISGEGVWINAKTSDATVTITILYYLVNA